MTRLLVCLLLLGACTSAVAHEVRHQAAGGDGGSAVDADPAVAHIAPAATAVQPARPALPMHKPATVRGGDNSLLRAPRWHSFLPGMFR